MGFEDPPPSSRKKTLSRGPRENKGEGGSVPGKAGTEGARLQPVAVQYNRRRPAGVRAEGQSSLLPPHL